MNSTVDHVNLTDKYRTFYPTAAEHAFFSNAYGTFSRIGHILVHKTRLDKFKRIEVIPSYQVFLLVPVE